MTRTMSSEAGWRWEGVRVLVTGGSGFIGSHLVESLLERGADLHCLLRPQSRADRLGSVRASLRVHRADLGDRAAVEEVIRAARPEVVFHLAAVGVTDVNVAPLLAVRVNVEGTLNLLQALDGQYRVLVHVGTCYEYGDNEPPFREEQWPRPWLTYAITKATVWHFCRQFVRSRGWPLVVVRPFSVYGPRQPSSTFIPACICAALKGRDFAMTGGEQRRDFVYVSDVVDGMLRAASNPAAIGSTFNLCSGHEVSLYKVACRVVELVGRPIAIRRGAVPYRDNEVWRLVGDNSRARRVLGWTPRVSLTEGLRRTIAWFAAQEDAS